MIDIDPRTVILLAGVMSGFMAIIVFALKRSYPPAIKGMGDWALGLCMVSAGSLLAFGFGKWPDGVSVVLPRLLLPLGLFWAYVGTQRFFGIKPRLGLWVVLIALVVLAQVWFTHVEPNYHVRLVLSSGLATCLFLARGRQHSGYVTAASGLCHQFFVFDRLVVGRHGVAGR